MEQLIDAKKQLIPVTNLQTVDVLKTGQNLETAKVTQIIDFSEAQQVRILCILITLDAVSFRLGCRYPSRYDGIG